jgi:hypothetical protein
LYPNFKEAELFNDPYRNGILFAKLFCYLQKLDMFGLSAFPQTIGECRANLLKVMSVIRQKRPEIPSKLTSEESVEMILKGDRSTIFTILVYLKACYSDEN